MEGQSSYFACLNPEDEKEWLLPTIRRIKQAPQWGQMMQHLYSLTTSLASAFTRWKIYTQLSLNLQATPVTLSLLPNNYIS